MEGIKLLEEASKEAGQVLDVGAILREYKKLYPQPVWQLTEDIQRQAMMYANIIEALKDGKGAKEIREKYEELDLVPGTTLPNPNVPKLLEVAFSPPRGPGSFA